MRTYNLDPKAAASAGQASFVTETGKYIGKLTHAILITSQKSTEGVEFGFVTNDGLRANFLQLWTYNASGEELSGLKVLNAMMACLRTKSITPGQMTYETRDGRETKDGFPTLCNKPIGLLLQKEEYINSKGEQKFKFNIVAPFEAATELTAGEILQSKTAPEQLGRMVAMLKDRPMQASQGRRQQPAMSENPAAGFAGDDDIPF